MSSNDSKNISDENLENTFKDDIEDINNSTPSNKEENTLNELKIQQLEEEIKNLKNDRKLKTKTLKFVQIIIMFNIITTIALLIGYPIIYLITGKQIYSEKFLGFITGSQLIVMPLAILQIITKHLFPNKKDDDK
ncbi:hypothetical protein [Brachyspira hampsonii]|uniref:Uncharacterized protein n=1 Tax=Brachyspira hampsonii TaxID=1287055 RepID=A0AAC9TUZ2_9SPIR|nr:hypothetical protein [Brachyspira hampsonii]ASJ21712.1 hypothetical protein BHAMNSH16_08695 [Brachyspira hampsonii]ELV06961.1 hypothetical protein H263_01130 [Brachyspira hampsonii 30599]MBW5380238.1 hypothetical protein [Brachyspira hampsonii]MBW5410773.1 hypothetical protein [Brachyspira hampsonii]OEJ18833.1 hypothetical protein A9496_06385 [Brachyspira hampsonii]